MTRNDPLQDTFDPLREQLLAAAAEFKTDADALSGLLVDLVNDVQRASNEPLVILPVAHHSPSCAAHTVQRLREHPPRVIFIELCEDLQSKIDELKDCKLPIALQAFASKSDDFPESWVPLSVVAPLTEFSAEYQAIAFALSHEGVDVVFVDRSVDHIFQWIKPAGDDANEDDKALHALMPEQEEEEADEDELNHASSVGLQLGQMMPTFDDFREFLLQNARVNHFSEWWDVYVEQPTLGASFDAWRQTMILVGSLIRRIGTTPERLAEHENRERYMWTRMKEWLAQHSVQPQDAVYICGAAHAASLVDEWGTAAFGTPEDPRWAIPPRTSTEWLYGFIPSSYSAIERQFAHPRGTLALAENTWNKSITAVSITPFSLSARKKTRARPKAEKATAPTSPDVDLMAVMTRAPAIEAEDQAQLLRWCSEIVELARKNHYLATTADAIAIYETSVLLAGLRRRRHPSPYDFVDAAVTCLEKLDVPGKRDVRQLCGIMLGADRVGQVGYSSLPPLVQDVYDRLNPIGVTPKKTTITRWLIDFTKKPSPDDVARSNLLWRIHYLLPNAGVARPIMGEMKLGGKRLQESWDIKIAGEQQRAIIQLAFEGVTIEQVLEFRIKRQAHAPSATTVKLLELAEASILFADSPRLTEDVGERAVHLLTHDVGAQDAQAVFERVRRLIHYYRSTPGGLPHWIEEFVSQGYQHYATLLPAAFADRGTTPEQLSGMLAFLFNLEALALALGCNRSQVLIAIQQAGPITHDPPKLGLLWAAEWMLQLRDGEAMRAAFDSILDNPLSLTAFPEYLSGFLLALNFTPLVAPLAVELVSRAFADLPDAILMPWMPGLISSLRAFSTEVLPALFKEVFQTLPRDLPAVDDWVPRWDLEPRKAAAAAAPVPTGPTLSPAELAARGLLVAWPATTDALAAGLGAEGPWLAVLPTSSDEAGPAPTGPQLAPEELAARDLLVAWPATTDALAANLGAPITWTPLQAAAPSAPATSPAAAVDPTEAAARALLDAWPEALQAWATTSA